MPGFSRAAARMRLAVVEDLAARGLEALLPDRQVLVAGTAGWRRGGRWVRGRPGRTTAAARGTAAMPTSGKPYQRAKQTAAPAETLAMTPVRRRWLFALGPLLALAGDLRPAGRGLRQRQLAPGSAGDPPLRSRAGGHHPDRVAHRAKPAGGPGRGGGRFRRGRQRVGERVREILGCRAIDQVVITHFHVDHAGAVGRRRAVAPDPPPGLPRRHHLAPRPVGLRGRRRGATRGAGAAIWAAPRGKALNPRVIAARQPCWISDPQVELRVVAVDGAGALRSGDFGRQPAPPSENDYSVALAAALRAAGLFPGRRSLGRAPGRAGGRRSATTTSRPGWRRRWATSTSTG